jgi:hypothetical protein
MVKILFGYRSLPRIMTGRNEAGHVSFRPFRAVNGEGRYNDLALMHSLRRGKSNDHSVQQVVLPQIT